MLLYLSNGQRRYDQRAVPVNRRSGWEFQAVVAGACAPVLLGCAPKRMFRRRLWVFAPTALHGWTARPGERCQIVVMHFSSVPEAVREAADESGRLSVTLTSQDIAHLRRAAAELLPGYREPTDKTPLHEDRALAELSLLALKDRPARPAHSIEGAGRQRVERAMAWYAEHLDERPGLSDLAAAVHLSSAHLRRLFKAATGNSPRTAMQGIRIERAKALMHSTDWPLTRIAAACGFSGPTVFSRAFARSEGQAPRQWRAWRG